MPRSTASDFDEVLRSVAEVDGWMTDAQAKRLWTRAAAVERGGRIVEIGSHHGRSTIVLARGATEGVEVVAIDPHAGSDRGPREIHGSIATGDRDHAAFLANLERAGVLDRVRHLRQTSQEASGRADGPVDVLYIDGAHRYGPARADLRAWGRRVKPGGTLLVHDAFSSVGVTAAIATTLLAGDDFRYVGRVGSLAEYRRSGLTRGDRVRNGLRQLVELPWFVRNLAIKMLIVLHLRPLTRVLGSRTGEWPY